MMFLSTTVLWIVSALLSTTQVISANKNQQLSCSRVTSPGGEIIHSTFACQTYKFKSLKRILQNEYATYIIESATFRLRTEWTIELLNQFGDKKIITHPIIQCRPHGRCDILVLRSCGTCGTSSYSSVLASRCHLRPFWGIVWQQQWGKERLQAGLHNGNR